MKYFVVSDIHGHYDILKQSLEEKGFTDGEDETLIVIGDIFDRGNQPKEVMSYLKSINHKVLIRGNHEYMLRMAYNMEIINPRLLDMLKYNGTLETICELTDSEMYMLNLNDYDLKDNEIQNYWNDVRKKLKPIVDWVFSDEWVNYYEVNNLIFVHSSMPLQVIDIPQAKWEHRKRIYEVSEHFLEVMDDWRTKATDNDWYQAMWCNPVSLYHHCCWDKEINNDKKIICGHRRTSEFYRVIDGNEDKECEEMNPIFYGYGVMAIDTCTVLSHRMNVLVLIE